MGAFIDMVGRVCGQLTVKKLVMVEGEAHWICECTCGGIKTVKGNSLRRGATISCGCLRPERRSTRTGTPEYKVWIGIKVRVNDPNNPNYGGRGITMSKRWEASFEAFLADMGRRPSSKHQIDRINNDKGYFKSNCRGATPKVNCNNKRNVKTVTYRGKKRLLSDLSEEFDLPINTLYMRIFVYKWPVKDALTIPLYGRRPK